MSTATETAVQTPLPEPTQLRRPARSLIGWMRREEALTALAGHQSPSPQNTEHERLVSEARAAVARRPAGIDQADLIIAAPPELSPHIEMLRHIPIASPFFNEGWTVVVADLSRVCAAQPNVAIDDAAKRSAGIDAADLMSIAAVALPLPTPTMLPAVYNAPKQAWVFSSANPNLRILGQAQGQASGAPIFGFAIAVGPSFMHVASCNGRYILRDGYHRAYGLLARGITHAPVFFRDFELAHDLTFPPGLLPQEIYLGAAPPLLADYFNMEVAANTSMLVTQKVIIVQALDVATLG